MSGPLSLMSPQLSHAGPQWVGMQGGVVGSHTVQRPGGKKCSVGVTHRSVTAVTASVTLLSHHRIQSDSLRFALDMPFTD